MGIYNNKNRLATALKNLDKNPDILDCNKTHIKKFLRYIDSKGLTITRQCKYIYPLENISKWLNADFKAATKEDIEDLTHKIRNMEYSDWTKQDYMVVIKKFYKWLYNQDKDEEEWIIPKQVRFIKINKPKNAKKQPSEYITSKDVKLMADHCRTRREKALILTLFESGARIGELLNLKLKHVETDEYGVKLHISENVKTEYSVRNVRLVGSAPAITEWINEEHPFKNNKDSYLFCNVGPGTEGTQMSYASLKKILNKIKDRANLDKNIRPHLWRHGRATELAPHLSDSVRCAFFGWQQGSNMARVYTHNVETDKKILELNGLIKKEKDKQGKFKNIICPRCETNNPYGSPFCKKCNLGLDEKALIKFDIEKEKNEKLGVEFQAMVSKDPELMMKMYNLLAEQWAKLQQDKSTSE